MRSLMVFLFFFNSSTYLNAGNRTSKIHSYPNPSDQQKKESSIQDREAFWSSLFVKHPYSEENVFKISDTLPDQFKESLDLISMMALRDTRKSFSGTLHFYGLTKNPFAVIQNDDTKDCSILEQKFSEDEKIFIAQQIATILNSLHEENIVYRNLRAKHVFYFSNAYYRVQFMHPIYAFLKDAFLKWEKNDEYLPWSAPELLKGSPSSPATDMWAFGMLLFELWTGHAPYEGLTSEVIRLNILQNKLPELPEGCPKWYKDLIHACLRKKPSSRINALNAMQTLRENQHPWSGSFIKAESVDKEKQNIQPILDKIPNISQAEVLAHLLEDAKKRYHSSTPPSSHLVKYVGIIKEPFSVVTENFPSIAVSEYKELEETQKIQIAAETAEALSYLHEKEIFYARLQADNILYDGDTTKLTSHVHTRIQDQYEKDKESYLPWEAPEVLRGARHSLASDMWSFGITLIEIWTGQKPNPGERVIIPEDCPDWLKEIIRGCLVHNPKKRIQATKATRELLSQYLKNKEPTTLNDEKKFNFYPFLISVDEITQDTKKREEGIPFLQYAASHKNMYLRKMGKKSVQFYRVHDNIWHSASAWIEFTPQINKLLTLQHENILPFIGLIYSQRQGVSGMVTEAFAGKPLASQTLSDADKFKIAKDVAHGLAFLHQHDLTHDFVHASNVLYEGQKAVLIPSVGMRISSKILSGMTITAESLTYRHEDRYYYAPYEASAVTGRNDAIKKTNEVWHFGIFLLNLFSEQTLLPVTDTFAFTRGDLPSIPESLPEKIYTVIASCLKRTGEERISMEKIATLLDSLP